MSFAKRYLRVTHILFAVLLLIQLLPDKSVKEVHTGSLIAAAVGIEVIIRVASAYKKGKVT